MGENGVYGDNIEIIGINEMSEVSISIYSTFRGQITQSGQAVTERHRRKREVSYFSRINFYMQKLDIFPIESSRAQFASLFHQV
jgi:hypothetical protein